MKLLITGFDAFGVDKINPSYEAVLALSDKIAGIDLIKKQLPTKFNEAKNLLSQYVEEYKPDYVICVGQAAGRSKISLERVAINLMDAKIQDNDGYMPKDETIHYDGQLAYLSNLPLRKIEAALTKNDILNEISNSAGLFVCNSSLYHILYLNDLGSHKFKAGFIHIPLIPMQLKERDENVATMDLENIINALQVVINCLANESDII